MVDDYSRFIGLPRRRSKPAVGARGSESDVLPGDPGLELEPGGASDLLAGLGGRVESGVRGVLERRGLLPTELGVTAEGLPITMDAPTVRRTPEARVSQAQVAADETSPLLAQLAAIKGPGEVMTPESIRSAKEAYASTRGAFPSDASAEQAEQKEQAERQAQGAANTSKATSTDDEPNVLPYYKQAFLESIANIGRASRGESLARIEPGTQARAELQKWLASKQEREAKAAKLAQEERLEKMRALLGLAKEEAATGREKMQQEGATKRAEIEAGAKRDIQAAKEKALADARAAGLPTVQAKNEAKKAADEARRAADEADAQRKATEGMPYGYRLKPGANPSKGQREKAAEAIEQRDGVKPAIEQLERLTSQGAQRLLDPAARAEVQQMAQQIGTAVRSMENLGVPSGPDMKIQLALIGDPTSPVTEVAGNLPKLMNNLKDYFDRKAQVRLDTLGIEKDVQAPAGKVLLKDANREKPIPMTKAKADEFVAKDPKRFSIVGG